MTKNEEKLRDSAKRIQTASDSLKGTAEKLRSSRDTINNKFETLKQQAQSPQPHRS